MENSLSCFLFAGLVAMTSCIGEDVLQEPADNLSVVAVQPGNTVLKVNETARFFATYLNSQGKETPATISWRSSNVAIATIDNEGLAKAQAPGQVQIIATANGIESESRLLTVVSDGNQVATVTITASESRLDVGQKLQLMAKAANVDGQELPAKAFSWQSSNPAVVQVDESGQATAIASGLALVTATAEGIKSSNFELRVNGKMRTGTFQSLNAHSVVGVATLSENSNQSLSLHFSADFSSSFTNAVYIFLSNNQNSVAGAFEVAKLDSPSGEKTFDVPTGARLGDYKYVVIHCRPFNIVFGAAELK